LRPPHPALDRELRVGRGRERSDLILVLGHDERRHRGVEGVFRSGRPLEHRRGLHREALVQQGVSRDPAALVDRTGQCPRVDLDRRRRPHRIERPDAEAVLNQSLQVGHPSDRARSYRARAADLEHGLRGLVLLGLGAPMPTVECMRVPLTGPAPKRVLAGREQQLSLGRHRAPDLPHVVPPLRFAPPAREGEREVEPDNDLRIGVCDLGDVIDELATFDARLSTSPTLASIWWALRSSEEAIRPLGTRRHCSESFAITLDIEAPIRCLKAGLIKTLLDGIISGMQSQTDQAAAAALAPRIAATLPATEQVVTSALTDPQPSVLGIRNSLINRHGGGVKWAPDDDYCVAARLLLSHAEDWRLAGGAAVVRPKQWPT
jgi:hypothetical protein